MGNKKKFDRLEPNDNYYETHLDEQETDFSVKKQKKREVAKKLLGVDAGSIPEKEKPSSSFKYTREKRKVIYNSDGKESVDNLSKAPFVYSLSVLCLVLAMRFVLASDLLLTLPETTALLLKAAMYIVAFVLPSVVYLFLPHSGRNLHNIRRFSMSHVAFSASCLGLLLFITALQKYIIAYVFSYSEPTASSGGNLLVSILMGALMPAVCEELFARGVLQYEISKYAGGFCGVTVSAFVFAMLHFELQYFMIYFVSGIILGCVTHVTRSVFPAMAVHFLNNTLSIVFTDKLSFVATERIGGALLIIVLAALCFGFLILTLHLAEIISEKRAIYYLQIESRAEGENKTISEKNTFFVLSPDKKTPSKLAKVLTNPLMLISIAIFAVIAFLGM